MKGLNIYAEDDFLEAVIKDNVDNEGDEPRVYMRRATSSADDGLIDDTHDLTSESIKGSPPSADDDRRVGPTAKKH